MSLTFLAYYNISKSERAHGRKREEPKKYKFKEDMISKIIS
jgi:hypothetical protein